MNKEIQFLKNTIIIFIGRFSTQFLSLILLSLYTFYLTTEEFGTIDLIQTYISLLTPIISLRIDTVFFRFVLEVRDFKEKKEEVITNGLIILIIILIMFSIGYVIFSNLFNTIPFLLWIFINIISVVISNAFLQILRGFGDNIGYAKACIIVALLNILSTLLFFYVLEFRGETILIASSIANISCCIYIFFRIKLFRYFKIGKQNKSEMKKMLSYSLPMIPDGLSWWIISASDRTLIGYHWGNDLNGIYAISCKFSNILSSIFTIINMSWQESASVYINSEDRDEFFSKIFNTMISLTFSICIILIAWMFFVFKYFIDSSYIEGYKYVPILLIANIFNAYSILQGGILIAKMQSKVAAKTTLLGAIINLVINLLFINRNGILAAALSTMISYFIICIFREIQIKKYVSIKLNIKDIFILCVILCITIFIYYINMFRLQLCYAVIVFVILCIINKNYINNFFRLVKGRKNDI